MARSISADDYSHVRMIVRSMVRLAKNITSDDVEDLIQVGMIGLLSAINTYDPDRNCSLDTYSNIRIRGAIIDYMRAGSFLPRGLYGKATATFCDADELRGLASEDKSILSCDQRIDVERILAKLPQKERVAIIRHYLCDEPMKQIGIAMGLTEARICQLCSSGLNRVRKIVKREMI